MSFTPDPYPYSHPAPSSWKQTLQPNPPAATNEDIINQLIRMETRLVKLMYHVGLDANGRVREEN